MTTLPDDLPLIAFEDATAWESWIEANPDARGVWLRIAKTASGVRSVTYDEALDVALCHGWIDGQRRALDPTSFAQRFTPRRPRGLWSKRNVAKAEALIAAGRMRPAGMREVEAAKSDGRWEAAYAGTAARDVPVELADALKTNAKARRAFERLDSRNRYAFCWRVQTAKRESTRRARAAHFVAMLERGETLH